MENTLMIDTDIQDSLTTLFTNFSSDSVFSDSLRIGAEAGNIDGCIRMIKEQYISNPELIKQILAVELLTIIAKL